MSRRCVRADRCPASSRPTTSGTYVMKFTGAGTGPQDAGRRGRSAGELARRLGLRVPGAGADPARPGDRARRAGPGGPGPAEGQRRAQPRAWTSCPASSASTRSPSRWSPAEAGRIVWFDALDRQRRPVLAQPQHAGVARRPVAHRPRRHDDLAPQLARRRRGRRQAVRRLRPRARPASRPDVAAAAAELAPLVTEELLTEVTAEVPDEWLADEPGFDTPGRGAPRVRASCCWPAPATIHERITLGARAQRDRQAPRSGCAPGSRGRRRSERAATGGTSSSTRCCAWCRGSSAAS